MTSRPFLCLLIVITMTVTVRNENQHWQLLHWMQYMYVNVTFVIHSNIEGHVNVHVLAGELRREINPAKRESF